ncbi:MAG: hypothetical protein P8P74_16815 [Crocinitomicaceae bacterium]|nr:hypothetical protein [Crocinitomicaceae bacterium]
MKNTNQGLDNTGGENGDEFLVRILSQCLLSMSTGFEEEKPSFKAYPNPVNDHLTIEGLEGNETFRIINLSGQLIAVDVH